MEIVYRSALMFLFLWVITRVVGRSTLGELSTFELLLYVTMGDLVQGAVTQQDYSLTGGILAVGVFALLTITISYVNWRWPRARKLIEGVPVVVITDGEPVIDSMRKERLSIDDLMTAAREEGIRRFSDVDLAVLESNGRISFFTRSADNDGATDGPPFGT